MERDIKGGSFLVEKKGISKRDQKVTGNLCGERFGPDIRRSSKRGNQQKKPGGGKEKMRTGSTGRKKKRTML